MPILAIIITVICEQKSLLSNMRRKAWEYLEKYVEYFIERPIDTPRKLRLIYLFACLPVIIILLGLKLVLIKHMAIMLIINLFLFMLSIQILTWKEEAKQEEAADKRSFINTYATRFFAPLFWFLILPSAIGSISYLIIICQSAELKARNLDTLIYNHVVDKMLFYANLIPYALLFLLIALAGDFEEVTHYIVEQKKNFSKSFYFLENMLHEIVLIAIGKGKFQIDGTWYTDQGEIEAAVLDDQRFTREITAYIVAILYRASLFFIGIIAVVCIAAMF
ncbi:MAG: hypothetical protein KBD37_01990 [Burkholderiales bacterium]|nr:hypothetical protein [Burkholderiales bacterium]